MKAWMQAWRPGWKPGWRPGWPTEHEGTRCAVQDRHRLHCQGALHSTALKCVHCSVFTGDWISLSWWLGLACPDQDCWLGRETPGFI